MSTNINIKQSPTKTKSSNAKTNKNSSSKPKRKEKPRQKKAQKFRNSLSKNCYSDLLNDPFHSPPCRIGFGTMVPTQLGSVVYRASVAANADGSMGVFVNPSVTAGPIYIANSGFTTATWTSTGWLNLAAYPATIISECRIIALGLKLTPLVAETVAPVTAFAGAIAGVSTNTIGALTPSQASSYTALSPFIVRGETLMACSRPLDNSAYEFLVQNYTTTTNNLYPSSIPLIVLSGLPASTPVLIECVMHFEYIPVVNTVTTRQYNTDFQPSEPKISENFSSVEKLWEYTTGRLNPSAVFDLAASFTNLMTARTIRRGLMGPQGGLALE